MSLKRIKMSNITEENKRKFMVEMGTVAFLKEPENKIPVINMKNIQDKKNK